MKLNRQSVQSHVPNWIIQKLAIFKIPIVYNACAIPSR